MKEYKEHFDIKAEKLVGETEKENKQQSEILFGDYLFQWLNDKKGNIIYYTKKLLCAKLYVRLATVHK